MMQRNGEGVQKQEWRKVRILEPVADKIDAQGRFIEQLEEFPTMQQSNPEVKSQWQVARGKSATKKSAEVIREKEVDIANAFKALVDIAQKIVQLSKAQGAKEKQNKKAREGTLQQAIVS